jgi:hypothetical protein
VGCVCGEKAAGWDACAVRRRPGWDAEAGQAGSGCGPGLAGRNALLRPDL